MAIPTKATLDAIKAANSNRLTSIFTRYRTGKPVNIINPELCQNVIKKADLSMYASKKPILIDMNPGACVWSAALHDYLKPRNHILLEPEKRYAPILEEFTAARPNAYWVPLDGYEWATYSKLFKPNPPCPPWPVDRAFPDFDPKFVPPEDGVNPDIIFTGNLSFSQIKEERLLAQFLNCTTLGLWVQKYGRVRYLIWAHDELKERYLPRSVGSRGRATVISETVCDVREIASSPILRTGKGRPRPNEIELDDEGNVVIPTYEARTTVGRPSLGKKKVERTVGRPRKLRMSVEEIGDALKRIEEARGDEAALEALEAELIAKEMTSKKYSRRKIAAAKKAEKEDTDAEKPTDEEGAESTEDMPKKRMGRPRVFGPEPLKKKKGRSRYSGQAMLTPELERIRVNLIRVVKRDHKAAKDITDELFDEINAKNISMIRQRRKIAEGVQVYLESDREGWISGMEHPPWWYKNNPAEIESLVDTILERRSTKHTPEKTGFEHHIQGTGEETAKQIEALESLEDPEKKEDKVLSEDEGKSTSFDEFEDRWVKKSDAFGIHRGNEDAAIAYQKGVLKWHKRPFEPIAVEDSDFWPKVPLALLDFTPVLTDEFFRSGTHAQREYNWEIYNWLLRGLLSLRAHGISDALGTLVPGGEHALSEVDEVAAGGKIDPKERPRTMTVKQFVEVVKAWDKWPFKEEGAHLDEHEDPLMMARGKKKWGA